MAESDIPSLTSIFTLSNPVVRIYLICVSILVLKVLLSVLLIVRLRFKKRIVISPEDLILKDAVCGKEDPEIERCRRAYLNDLENKHISEKNRFDKIFLQNTRAKMRNC
uniref:Microsomal glutathione S-transferase 1 n=1 Tax=Cacopsylla melanoneura TaxID=428564 RepID=A0A8D8LX19_9HEMI